MFFMILKLIAIAALVAFGLTISSRAKCGVAIHPPSSTTVWQSLIAFGAALIPAQFAYGGGRRPLCGWEVREPRRNLPRGLLFGCWV